MRRLVNRTAGIRTKCGLLLAAGATTAWPAVASAHAGEPLAPHDLWWSWNLSPVLLGGLFVLAWLYGRGVAARWHARGRHRVLPRWRLWAFAAGLVTLAVALISPLDALAVALFSAHMAQHLLLTLAAAPLLVAAILPLPLLWALPRGWRLQASCWSHAPVATAARRGLGHPVTASLLYATALWIWHWPVLYEAALRNEAIHALEHATLFGTALLFWWILMQPLGQRRANQGAGIFMAFATMVHGTVLGAAITFADSGWYATYGASSARWGLSAIADQRLAGALMLMPAGFVYIAAALLLVTGWLRAAERRQTERDAAGAPSAPPPSVAIAVSKAGAR
jgi:cytochrome c oxidase assembly factor CtaG